MTEVRRRSFLGFLGAAPLVARRAADEEFARATSTVASGLARDRYPGTLPSAESDQTALSALAHLKLFGIPQHDLDRIWEETRYVFHLDPDVAAKRSWSMSVKVSHQRLKNYERRIATARRSLELEVARSNFFKMVNWRYWFG